MHTFDCAGDELIPAPDGGSTRAIDIEAPAADVWPWLDQMGPSPRGGAYTYDGMVPMEPASLIMERRMLREIKRLSERLARG